MFTFKDLSVTPLGPILIALQPIDLIKLFSIMSIHLYHLFILGFGAAWHLAYIEVEDLSTRKVFTFHCNKWLSKSEDDKQILRELTCGTSAKGSSPDMRGDRTGRDHKFSDARKLSRDTRKPTFWFPTWSDTNQAVQLQKMARGLKFRI